MLTHRSLCILGVLGMFHAVQGQGLTATLSATNYNGFQISCFGASDGQVSVAVNGGTPPYIYQWSTGDSTTTVSGLAAGFIRVKVSDAVENNVEVETTLREPNQLKLTLTPFKYPSGMNISCYECFNGSLDLEVQGGVQPYNYQWADDVTTQDRSGLGAMQYDVVVTDLNGCFEKANAKLEQPEKATWGMTGNMNTDPSQHYIGTSDNADVVFKSNDAEVVRLKSNGDISIHGSLTEEGPLFRMADGTIRGGGGAYTILPAELCRTLNSSPYWETQGNSFSQLCPEEDPILGTLANMPLKVVTNGVERMRVTETGEVAIGAIYAPETKLHVQGDILVRGGTYGDIITRSGEQEGVTLWARNYGAAWGLSIDPTGKGHILGDWNNPTPHLSFTYDHLEIPTQLVIGDVETPTGYRLFVQEGILTERIKVALHGTSQWADHVFKPNYELRSLDHVRRFITEHGHLPGIPSASDMVKNGLDVLASDALLLEKIEELTLYILQLEERISHLEVR